MSSRMHRGALWESKLDFLADEQERFTRITATLRQELATGERAILYVGDVEALERAAKNLREVPGGIQDDPNLKAEAKADARRRLRTATVLERVAANLRSRLG